MWVRFPPEALNKKFLKLQHAMKSKDEVSAGGVVVRKSNGLLEVLVCKHSGYHKWVLPKGRIENKESLAETATREVEEETGVQARVLHEIVPPEEYVFIFNGEKIDKKVHYFLMEYVSGFESDHDFEMEEVRWVSFEEAIELMGFDGAKQVLRKAQNLLS